MFVGLKCAQASLVSVYLSAFIFLSVVFIDFFYFYFIFLQLLFCFLDKAGVCVGSSIVVPPVFPFFSPRLPCPFVFLFKKKLIVFFIFIFLPSSSPFFFFCVYYEFILAEDLCVHFPLLFITLSFS